MDSVCQQDCKKCPFRKVKMYITFESDARMLNGMQNHSSTALCILLGYQMNTSM